MSEIYHYIWALLPLALLISGLRAYWRKAFVGGKRDYPWEFLKQFAFCSVLLVIAITVDRTFFDDFFSALPLEDVDPRIPRWLIYPALMLGYASVQNHFKMRKDEEERAEMVARQKKYTQRGY